MCPFCPGSSFPDREAAMDHIRRGHPEEVTTFLEQARSRRSIHMTDPETWAASELVVE
jgi:hypothetical protein